MKNLLVKLISASLLGLLIAGESAAQQGPYPEDKALIHRPFQFSFIHPIGTNGLEGGRTVNGFSVNLLLGYAAGLDGMELAGFANLEKYHVGGIQLAGFFNGSGGSVEGMQLAGFANLSRGRVQGSQFAGFANVNGGYSYAAQFAGFANVVADSSSGFQLAGFGNRSARHNGLQIAGFGNLGGRQLSGFQLAGCMNIAERVDGMQLAGFMNIAERVGGMQLAGFINITKQLKGLQLGVVNVVDSVEEGTPIGLFSFVRKGYNHWEVWVSETMHLNSAFKFGTRRFYNILAVGGSFQPLTAQSFFGLAYGLGHAFVLPKAQLSLDILGYQLHETSRPFRQDNGFQQLYQLKLSYDHPLKKGTLFAGPVFNTLVQYTSQTNDIKWSSLAPYAFYSRTHGRRNVQLWAGLQAGIRF